MSRLPAKKGIVKVPVMMQMVIAHAVPDDLSDDIRHLREMDVFGTGTH